MSADSTNLAPQRFGRYVLLDRLGWGGMAEIFLALAQGEGGFEKYLVIKRILPHLASDPQFVKMFLREAKLAALLQHANIVQIFDVGRVGGELYIAMEYIEGTALNVILRECAERKTPLPVPLAMHIARDLLQGLSYAHSYKDRRGTHLQIIHRDISPSNVLLSIHGLAKLGDFGVARAENSEPLTQTGALKGKMSYLAPEQLAGSAIDQRADVFAAGIVLHEMLTGRRLFRGASDALTVWNIQFADVRKPSKLRAEVPPEVDEVVMKAVTRDLGQRYQTSGEFLRDFNDAWASSGTSATHEDVAALVRRLVGDQLTAREARLAATDANNTLLAGGAQREDLNNPTLSGEFDPEDETSDLRSPLAGLPTRAEPTKDIRGHSSVVNRPPTANEREAPTPGRERGSRPEGTIANGKGWRQGLLLAAAVGLTLSGVGVGWWLSQRGHSSNRGAPLAAQTDTMTPAGGSGTRAKLATPADEPARSAAQAAAIAAPPRPPDAQAARSPGAPKPAADARPAAVATKAAPGPRRRRHGGTSPKRHSRSPQAFGTLEIITIPWTEVSLDNKPLGTTPIRNKSVPAGSYTLRLKNPAAKINITQQLTVVAGKVLRIARKLN